MAKSTVRVLEKVQQPTPPMQEESEAESDVEFKLDGEPEKDDTEAELERLVFGDSAAFREGLKDFALEQQEADEEDEQPSGLEGLDDADVGQAHLKQQEGE